MLPLLDDKYKIAANLLDPAATSILDIGCRDAILKKSIPGKISYTGVDLCPGKNVDRVCDLTAGLPYEDKSFDVVVVLDVLEHTDNIHSAFGELARVSKKQIIVMLPNLYHWRIRLQYLAGIEMDKYKLATDPPQDRHRWLLSYNSSQKFCQAMALKYGFSLKEQVLYGGKSTLILDAFFGLFSRNLGSWSTFFIFNK